MSKVKLIARDLEMSFGARLLFKADVLSFCQGDVIYLQGDNHAIRIQHDAAIVTQVAQVFYLSIK